MMASTTEESTLSESILAAQREADAEADRLETIPEESEDQALPMVPKLLQLTEADLRQKTHELRATGNQLDLLLLKAESYSHFILENQKRSQIKFSTQTNTDKTSTKTKGGKRKSPSELPQSSRKKSKDILGASSPDPELEPEPTQTSSFVQPPNLVGGTLLPYQLEGLQWLLSLWENGLSGILADEVIQTHTFPAQNIWC